MWTTGLGAVMVLAGFAFGPTPLLVPGVGLVVLGVACGAWVAAAARGEIERRLGSARVVEDAPCPLHLELRTPLAPPPGSELVEPLASDELPPALDWRRRVQHFRTEALFPRRGLVRPEPARLIVRDPLGLACRELRSPVRKVLVLPRTEPVRAAARASGRASAPAANAAAASDGAEIEVHSLREAPPGASATRIHWPAFARTGTLIERTLRSESDRRPLVVLDAARPASTEALDSAVRAAASICLWLAHNRGCDLLLPGERRPATVDVGLVAWPALHARLALVEAGGAAPAVERLGRGTVFWVTASAASGPPRGLLRAAASARYLVVPGPPSAAAVFEVAGCHGRRLARAATRTAA